VNVTYWHGPYPNPAKQMQDFAGVLRDLMETRKIAAVQYVTIQNEVNSTKVTMPLYQQLYRLLDADLKAAGIRDRVKFVGGDLLRDGQRDWFEYMAKHMADVLDGYSVHIYWDYTDTDKLVSRLKEVRAIVNSLPSGRKPLYVTEFGVRGVRAPGEAQPGHDAAGTPMESTNTAALQQAWFDILAARLGYVATVRWDAYFAMYDKTRQNFSMIGPPQGGWATRPSFRVARMLTHTVKPGSHAVAVSGSAGGRLVTAFKDGSDTTVLLLNNNDCRQRYHIEGLPTNRNFYFIVWNAEGDGGLKAEPPLHSSSKGGFTASVPPHSVVSLTTIFPALRL
jgi:hypothetical protein